jgi:hypothetical protein
MERHRAVSDEQALLRAMFIRRRATFWFGTLPGSSHHRCVEGSVANPAYNNPPRQEV